jgi:ABC-type transport system involved in multi-copper enzyme maturation permease subunit
VSFRRFAVVFGQELSHTLKRPLFWFLIGLLALVVWGMSTGSLTISSGDASVGGKKAWVTSEFNFAFTLTFLIGLLYSFFVSIASGMAVIADDEAKIREILGSTPVRASEYVWGKFLAIFTGFVTALAIHLLLAIFFNHILPNPAAAEIRGPLQLSSYLRPAVTFGLPGLLFYLGCAFYLGERFRRPVSVFLFPTFVLLLCAFFFWSWTPTWLDPRLNRLLMWLDPSGVRWLSETWLKQDRGAQFYNTTRIGFDLPFVLSRLVFLALGLAGVFLAQRHLSAKVDATTAHRQERRWGRRAAPVIATSNLPHPALAMRARAVGLWSSLRAVAGVELSGLLVSPGIYLFGVLILVQAIGASLFALGAFQTELLLTPGLAAVRTMNTLSLLLCFLLLFYTVESIERERRSTLASLTFAAPTPTFSLLFGKVLANSAIGAVMIFTTFLGCAIAMLIQGTVPLDPMPFVIVWGFLLLPTVFAWSAFVLAIQSAVGQRFVTYGLALSALAATGYFQATQQMSWLGNWWLWNALQWSDMGPFQLDRRALLLNRVMVLSLGVFLIYLAARIFRRRQPDPIGTAARLRPGSLLRSVLRALPIALVPLVSGAMLWNAIIHGPQGKAREKKEREYWKQNLATWKDAPQPSVTAAELDVRLEPSRSWLRSRGTYELANDRESPLRQFALTGGAHWRKLKWTLEGKPYKPENRTGLYVFTPPIPMSVGSRLHVGFDFEGQFPDGISKNGGGRQEFILPAGVVLTGFSSSFAPQMGFQEEIGVKKGENDYEPKVYAPDFYFGKTDAGFGLSRGVTTHITLTAPANYTLNSVGTLVSDRVAGGLRTSVWVSDHPVRLFNVVAGHWKVRRGHGTALYYYPGHSYNVAEMSRTLDAARRYYSEWFYPFPWRELKLSEFPALAGYAQGFPTNISFSEAIGFLTKSDVKTDAVFLVTAHESAHQWWGNILTPGKGPGADILSEGMAHFSTALLFEQVKGARARMEFLKRIEESYGDRRRKDAERPLVLIDGSHDGDETVTYDKGGWVFWMMLQQMGRERALAGLKSFIATWKDGPDFPVLQDFTAAMRPFAPDPAAFDAFVKQWFHQVVLPEYQLSDGHLAALAGGPGGGRSRATFRIKNAGSGRMPVEVAAERGERFGKDNRPNPKFQEARATVVLGPGEERTLSIDCSFQPERVTVDPEVRVLQLRRKAAVLKLS